MQYLLAHWRGELSLTKSTLLNGAIVYLTLVFAFLGAGQYIKSPAFIYFGLVVFVGWVVWAVVGIVRCAFKIIFSNHSTTLRRVVAIVAVLCAFAAAIASAQDLFYLFAGTSSHFTGGQLRPADQDLATRIRASGLEGDWCAAKGTPKRIRVDSSGIATWSSVFSGKEKLISQIVNFEAVGPHLFRITIETSNSPNPSRTVAMVYKFDGRELKTLDSRDNTGTVIIENGKWNVGPEKGIATLSSVRCEN